MRETLFNHFKSTVVLFGYALVFLAIVAIAFLFPPPYDGPVFYLLLFLFGYAISPNRGEIKNDIRTILRGIRTMIIGLALLIGIQIVLACIISAGSFIIGAIGALSSYYARLHIRHVRGLLFYVEPRDFRGPFT
jgi:hypothetical protein